MKSSSQSVKDWRRKTKTRMIDAMGGRCSICSYQKSQNALEFHHLDPAEKDFSFGSIRSNPKNWPAIVAELSKCVLLCANCHREVHEGTTELPPNFPRFDETFADYQATERAARMDACPICGNEKLKNQVACSLSCAGNVRYGFDWSDLVEMKKTMTNSAIARELGCSETSVRKRLSRLSG